MASAALTKGHLVDAVCRGIGLTRRQSDAIVDTVIGSMIEALLREEVVELRGLGSFRPKRIPEHKARNPLTGESVTVAPRLKVCFRMGRALKSAPVPVSVPD
jgi:integration host factor subunit alpha